MTTPWTDWDGCYDGGWGDLIVPEAYAHPAKFRPGLIDRIYKHGFERGWWKRLDVIGDPFGGIGGGGIMAAFKGLRWIGVELEPKFVELAGKNFARHKAAWLNGCDPIPEIIQGDSRQFAELVLCSSIVTSPPYAQQQTGGGIAAAMQGKSDYPISDDKRTMGSKNQGYQEQGNTPGQIGNLKAIVTSPPYAESLDVGGPEKAHPDGYNRKNNWGGYGGGEGNIGNLRAIVTSPPWEKTTSGHDEEFDKVRDGGPVAKEYGDSAGQLGNTSGEDYWSAMKLVYTQCHQAIHPGGMLVVVVKDFVKGGKRVPLCDQTLALLESLGFELVERIRAWVTKTKTHAGLFGDVEEKTERKSFFRRLAESKGSPAIDWEEVIAVKTSATEDTF